MLFLAVFGGFWEENQREHYVEHQREKRFMRSVIEAIEAGNVSDLETIFERANRSVSGEKNE
jgi:predicted class III extradiol MEMO1 family dioxygenase